MLKILKQNSKRLFYKHKVVTRVTSMLLVFTLLFTSLPLGGIVASAADVNQEDTIITVEKELTEYRTEYSKTYLMSNNTLESVISANPMHYKNAGGNWQDIDSTLVLEETEDGEVYKNKAGGFDVYFPATNENGSSVKIESGEHTIEIELVESKKAHARKDTSNKNKAKKLTKEQRKIMTASELYAVDSNQNSALEYNEVYDNTNVRYDINPTSVKESVIINKAPNKKVSYSYNIKANGLVAQLNNDGSVAFYEKTDTKKQTAIFVMPAPLMYDANDIYCYDIETTLKQKKGVYTLTYKPDYNWLKSKDRAYPVVLDPTTYVANSTQDAYTYSADEYQNRNIGSENQIKVGRSTWKDPNGDTFETFIRFDELPAIPDGYVINSALLMLTTKAYHGTWQELEVGAHKVTEDWTNKLNQPLPLINYLNQPDAESFPRATAHIVRGEVDTEVGFEISALVNEWYEDPTTNYGVKLSLAQAPPTDADNVLFHSSRATSGIPYLSITCEEYVPVTDIEITNKQDELELFNLSSSFDVAATVYPENATNKQVIWEVANENIAYYNNGQIYGVNIGTTTVTAKSADNGEIFDSFELEVFTIPIESIQITNCPTDFLDVGRTHSFNFALNPDNASHLIDPSLASWSSSNPAVAEIDYYGNATAYSAGQTTISVCYAGFSDSCVLNVAYVPITRIFTEDTDNELFLSVGEEHIIDFRVLPTDATNKRATITSSNPTVVGVSNYNYNENDQSATPRYKLTALANGTSVIYVEFLDNPTMNFTTVVTVGIDNMQLNPPPQNSLEVGDTWELVGNPNVNINILDTNILSIDGSGNITALAPGTTMVELWLGNTTENAVILEISVNQLNITGINRMPTVIEENELGEEITYHIIYVNQTISGLFATALPEDSASVVWQSTNSNIVSVSNMGEQGVELTGHFSYSGDKADVIISVPGTNVSGRILHIKVMPLKVTSIEATMYDDYNDHIVYFGETANLKISVLPKTPVEATFDSATWVYDESSAMISWKNKYNYTFTPTNISNFTVQAKIDNVLSNAISVSTRCPEVEIKNKPSYSITDEYYDRIYILSNGVTHQLSSKTTPTYAEVTWRSKNVNAASINPNTGLITTAKNLANISANTVIFVTASVNGYTVTDSFTLKVAQLNGLLIWDDEPITVGDTCNLTVEADPLSRYNTAVTWTSSDTTVATVDANGKVTGKNAGYTVIKAISKINPNIWDYVVFDVCPKPNGITITNKPTDNRLEMGQTHQLGASITPAEAIRPEVTWRSSDSTVATVDKNGKITAIYPGTTTISASIPGGIKQQVAITVYSSDPFHESNIEYIRIKKFDASEYGGDKEIITIVTKSKLSQYERFEAMAPERDTAAFEINEILVNKLISKANSYPDNFPTALSVDWCYCVGRYIPDIYVEQGLIEAQSAEYYGIWANETNNLLIDLEKGESIIQLVFASITAAYSIYNIVSAMNSAKLSINSTQTYNAQSYRIAASNVDDMFDELSANGTKFTKENTMWITRTYDGKICWLETGTANSGFKHILDNHPVSQFSSFNVSSELGVSSLIYNTVSTKTPVGTCGSGGLVYSFGNQKYLNVVISSNGYIVSAHNISGRIDLINFY